MKELKDKLLDYAQSGMYPFHMPGHKRNVEKLPYWNPWQIDVTEVEGTDNLHHAEGILKEAMDRAAGLSGADQSYFLVNGSTGGILSAIASVVHPGDTVLVARNCHKSVYHAISLNHLKAIYIYPEWIAEYRMAGGICLEKLLKALKENPQIRAVILTSPTYEGMVSDIGQIARLVHSRGIPLLVDEAHGAHFNQEGFPASAVKKGADLVIQSYHKTLPALTQTGVLHRSGALVDKERLEHFLAVYQTSSPSYVLMSSIDYAVSFLEQRTEEMKAYAQRLEHFRQELSGLSHIRLPGRELVGKYGVYDVDNSKLILHVCGKAYSGRDLYEELRLNYALQCEMSMESYALAMTSVMDAEEGYERLKRALYEIDAGWERQSGAEKLPLRLETGGETAVIPESVCTITQAEYARKRAMKFDCSAGQVSGEYLYLYPPGIPLLVPGERITEQIVKKAEYLQELGFELQGLRKEKEIQVCDGKNILCDGEKLFW